MDTRDINHLQQIVTAIFAEDSRISAVYLFGSAARGDNPAPRDFDVALLASDSFDPAEDFGLAVRAQTQLAEATARSVDVVLLNHADPVLQYQVRRDGLLLLERNRTARVEWEVTSRKLWFDRQPAHRRYMRKLEERLLATGDTDGR